MKQLKKIIKKCEFSNYIHLEMIVAVPFAIWFIWRLEEIVGLLNKLIIK
jgi:hypothetical protein